MRTPGTAAAQGNRLPVEAADWIASLYPGEVTGPYLQKHGCAVLTVKQIKDVHARLEALCVGVQNVQIRKSTSYTKKAQRVAELEVAFYADAARQNINTNLMNTLKRLTPQRVTPQSGNAAFMPANQPLNSPDLLAASRNAIASLPTYNQNPHASSPYHSNPSLAAQAYALMQAPPYAYNFQSAGQPFLPVPPYTPPIARTAGYTQPDSKKRPASAMAGYAHAGNAARRRIMCNVPQIPVQPWNATPNAAHATSAPAATGSRTAGLAEAAAKVSASLTTPAEEEKDEEQAPAATATTDTPTENATAADTTANTAENTTATDAANGDSDDAPQNPMEIKILQELQQMGFDDKSEMLVGIRHFTNDISTDPVSSDQVMMWIVTQREELQEARKMDMARLESERFRADNAAKQAEAAKTKLQSISTMQDYRAMFTESWILKDNACVAHLEQLWDASAKEALTQLLQVEAKSAKWYCQLPRAYFEDLSKDLARQSTLSVLMDRVRQESEKLNSALFKLSEQQGGVPRIYLQAAEARKAEGHDKQNHDNGNDDDNDDDDDEIVFLKCEQLASEKAGPCVKQNGGAAFRSVA